MDKSSSAAPDAKIVPAPVVFVGDVWTDSP
jgi:hypothetical protein